MAKASRKRSGQAAKTTNGGQQKPAKLRLEFDENGEFCCHDEKGNRVPCDPNEKVRFTENLTPELCETLARLQVTTQSEKIVVPSGYREKFDRRAQQSEARRQEAFQESLGAIADAIASRIERPPKKRKPKNLEAKRSKAEQRREEEKCGDEWLRGRNCGQYVKYADMAKAKGLELWDLNASLDRDRHYRADVWAANKKPRRKKAVKTR